MNIASAATMTVMMRFLIPSPCVPLRESLRRDRADRGFQQYHGTGWSPEKQKPMAHGCRNSLGLAYTRR